ncbi:DUF1294 domain-containing protein [Xylanibacter brevis]|uniref:DUF1294 domain-containing protein n=1 Tax=Xylanibacter brevis TaxID=83231 RepID=UPI0004839273|nr:DUF1294 domain-containing protein [Xylanibacter brevis]MCR5270518.1 DUF1294 domain-containing protein [Prevotella sp.]
MSDWVLYYLLGVNILTFLVYGIDKSKAKRKAWRISECTLLMLAVIGGSVGALFAMRLFHHKTLHKKFRYGVPLIMALQVVVALMLI